MMVDIVEKYAILMALGNNGGGWSTHYNEDQKNVWRERIRNFITDIKKELENDIH